MRLLVIQPTGDKRGHYGIYTTKLCDALGRLGHEVTLCTNSIHINRYLNRPAAFRLWEVRGGALKFERFDAALGTSPLLYYWGYFRNSFAITAAGITLARREPFDAVAIMDAEFMTASLLLRLYRHTLPPVVMFLWATNFSFAAYVGSLPQRIYKVVQRNVFRKSLGRGIQALAVLDDWHRDRLRPQLGLPPEFPIAVIPDGGEPSPEMPQQRDARRALGLDAKKPVFLFFGVLRKDKGVEYLLEAAAALVPEFEFTLVVAGWPMEYTPDHIGRLVRRLGLQNHVAIRPEYIADDDVATYFAASDALILPYTKAYTGGSGPLMKGACTYRRPVIVTRVAGMGSLVDECRIGLVAEPEDPRSLAERMREFLTLPQNERDTMATNAANVAAANSWDVLAARLTALVAEIR